MCCTWGTHTRQVSNQSEVLFQGKLERLLYNVPGLSGITLLLLCEYPIILQLNIIFTHFFSYDKFHGK